MNRFVQAGLFVAGIVVTAIVTHYVTKGINTVEEGAQALDDEHIRELLRLELQESNQVEIDGKTLTYGEALSKISSDVTRLTTTVSIVLDLPEEDNE